MLDLSLFAKKLEKFRTEAGPKRGSVSLPLVSDSSSENPPVCPRKLLVHNRLEPTSKTPRQLQVGMNQFGSNFERAV